MLSFLTNETNFHFNNFVELVLKRHLILSKESRKRCFMYNVKFGLWFRFYLLHISLTVLTAVYNSFSGIRSDVSLVTYMLTLFVSGVQYHLIHLCI